jgi:hypothetical protein
MEHRQPEEGSESLLPPLGEEEIRYSTLQLHFLQRLNRLLRLRYEQGTQLNSEGVRLLDRGIYSTYCDCVDLGISREAQQLLHRFPVPSAGRSET